MIEKHTSAAAFHLSEIGCDFSWAMCRNTFCRHFGVAYAGPLPTPDGEAVEDEHYRMAADGRMECKYCGLSFECGNNVAVRPIARYFLSLSLPFADCPDTACVNHGYNVFEHYGEAGLPTRARVVTQETMITGRHAGSARNPFTWESRCG